jgi:hypothetical protein
MIKCEIICSSNTSYGNALDEYNKKVKNFIETLSVDGHTFISSNTVVYGDSMRYFRNEIIYRENPTREVIFEKTSS